jgi:hypothetical protein
VGQGGCGVDEELIPVSERAGANPTSVSASIVALENIFCGYEFTRAARIGVQKPNIHEHFQPHLAEKRREC